MTSPISKINKKNKIVSSICIEFSSAIKLNFTQNFGQRTKITFQFKPQYKLFDHYIRIQNNLKLVQIIIVVIMNNKKQPVNTKEKEN